MKAADDENNLGFERNCANCNYFFPYLLQGPSEYGICLNDPEFEPYIDELLENENYDSCHGLIEEKKYDGNEHSCEDFEMIENIGTDSSTDEPSGIDPEDAKNLYKVVSFFLKNRSVAEYRKILTSGDNEKRLKAFKTLSSMVSWNNDKASKLLIDAFKELPPPVSLEEVHFKLEVFRCVTSKDYLKDLIPVLFRDLYETESTNRTRQWISEIFHYLSIHKHEVNVTENLEKMLTEKQFSYRIKRKIKGILDEDYY
jgi:hypothetical protein